MIAGQASALALALAPVLALVKTRSVLAPRPTRTSSLLVRSTANVHLNAAPELHGQPIPQCSTFSPRPTHSFLRSTANPNLDAPHYLHGLHSLTCTSMLPFFPNDHPPLTLLVRSTANLHHNAPFSLHSHLSALLIYLGALQPRVAVGWLCFEDGRRAYSQCDATHPEAARQAGPSRLGHPRTGCTRSPQFPAPQGLRGGGCPTCTDDGERDPEAG